MTTTLRERLHDAAGIDRIDPPADGVEHARRRARVLRRNQRALQVGAPALAVLVAVAVVVLPDSAPRPARVTTASSDVPPPAEDEAPATSTTTTTAPAQSDGLSTTKSTLRRVVPPLLPPKPPPPPPPPPTGSVAASAGRLAFIRANDIYLRTGDSVTRLTHDGAYKRGHPRWSPDGTRIVYTRERYTEGDLTAPPNNGYPRQDLWIVDVASGQEHKLVGTQEPYFYSNPIWMPDGRHIVFAKINGSPTWMTEESFVHYFSVEPDGSNQQPWNRPFYWSHDSRWAASICPDGDAHICLSSPDGGEPRPIPNSRFDSAATPQSFAWSPNDRSLAVESGDGMLIDVDGANRHDLGRTAWSISWSPDGSTVVFQTDGCLAAADRDGGNQRCLAGEDGDRDPAWSPPRP